APEAHVEVHPDTAARAGLTDGGHARVSSARGATLARVRLDPTLRADTVFLPFHFPGAGRANLLTNDALDPRSRMPEFKVCAVRIEPAELEFPETDAEDDGAEDGIEGGIEAGFGIGSEGRFAQEFADEAAGCVPAPVPGPGRGPALRQDARP
ncbi:hypothetical protein GTW69_01415, partial [Streptomyces sp. SID7760]|nr:hypothetical protein [Streptomyces sp. SID7760]